MGEANLLGSPAPNLGVSPQFQLGHLESRPVFPEKDHEVEAFSSRFPMDNLEKWPVCRERPPRHQCLRASGGEGLHSEGHRGQTLSNSVMTFHPGTFEPQSRCVQFSLALALHAGSNQGRGPVLLLLQARHVVSTVRGLCAPRSAADCRARPCFPQRVFRFCTLRKVDQGPQG